MDFPREQTLQEVPLPVVRAFLHALLKAGLAMLVAEAAVEEPLVLLEQAVGPPPGQLPLLSGVFFISSCFLRFLGNFLGFLRY